MIEEYTLEKYDGTKSELDLDISRICKELEVALIKKAKEMGKNRYACGYYNAERVNKREIEIEWRVGAIANS